MCWAVGEWTQERIISDGDKEGSNDSNECGSVSSDSRLHWWMREFVAEAVAAVAALKWKLKCKSDE